MAGPKKLYRSRDERIIAGICGGIAEYFNLDPVVVRLVTVLLAFTTGIVFFLYIVAWIIIPEHPSRAAKETKEPKKETRWESHDSAVLLGVIMIIIGMGLLMKNLFSWFEFKYVVPIAIIFAGIYLVVRGIK